MKPTSFGILGSGLVGQSLAADLARQGHAVMIGTRQPEKLRDFAAQHPGVGVGHNAQAAQFGELILLATRWDGTQAALELAGTENLAGKIVVDITNPLDFSRGAPALALGWNTSAGEQVQNWLPDAKVVKALNTVPGEGMLRPQAYFGTEVDVFIAGNDSQARQTVTEWLESVGWSVVDMGDLTRSRYLEPLAMIWILRSFDSGWQKRNHAIKLVNR